MSRSIEETIEDRAKRELERLGIKCYTKTATMGEEIDFALKAHPSKSGGEGKNYPDIRFFLQDSSLRSIPVMIEVKGIKGKLQKLKDGQVENKNKDGAISKNVAEYALNGAVHYAEAILDYTRSYDEVIAVGINGYEDLGEIKTEYAFYYLSHKNLSLPKKIGDFNDLSCFGKLYKDKFISEIDLLNLTEKERENLISDLESEVEQRLNALNQFLHDGLLNINPNQRVALLVGMIMAAQGVKDKVEPLKYEDLRGEQGESNNDGTLFINKITDFLNDRDLPKEKINLVIDHLKVAFIHSKLYLKTSYTDELLHNTDETPLKRIYYKVYYDILPLVKKLHTADIAGRLFNSITKWLEVPDSEKNDVVLTPRYVVDLMVKLARVNKDSYVWDYATGSGAFLISAMNAMIKDCENIQSPKEREKKIAHIKAFQLLGIEKRIDIYLLGILNMILFDDGSANLLKKDSLVEFNGQYEQGEKKGEDFPADVFLLNPPYSAAGKGFIFVERALKKMKKGRACVIIQENAGSGNGLPYTKEILKHSTLLASIKMPLDLFAGKSSVQTAIYVFEVGTPHDEKRMVKFIDFSDDGYKRAARKKSKASVNLRDAGTAKARYKELVSIVLDLECETNFYKDCVIRDTISLNGADWTFAQHKTIDTKPTLEDFKKCVSDYLAWEVSNILKQENKASLGKSQSPRLKELDEKFKQNGGTWKEFKIGDKFERVAFKKLAYKKSDLPENATQEYDLPALTCARENQGLSCYVPRNEATILKNVISVAANGDAPAFYQSQEFTILQDAYAIRFKDKELNSSQYLFLTTLLQKVLTQFNWSNKSGWERVKKEKILLPIDKQENIAFDYMESYIAELEAERVKELEAYLKATGFENFILIQNEMFALQSFEKLSNPPKNQKALNKDSDFIGGGELNYPLDDFTKESFTQTPQIQSNISTAPFANLQWKEFKIAELFESQNGDFDIQKTHLNNRGHLVVSSGLENAGVVGKTDIKAKIFPKHTITCDMFGNVFYRDFEYKMVTHARVFSLKFLNQKFTKESSIFVVATMNYLKFRFSYSNMASFEKIKNLTIYLPIYPASSCKKEQNADQDHQIAFDFIETFIKALQKESLKQVDSYNQAKIKAHKEVIRA